MRTRKRAGPVADVKSPGAQKKAGIRGEARTLGMYRARGHEGSCQPHCDQDLSTGRDPEQVPARFLLGRGAVWSSRIGQSATDVRRSSYTGTRLEPPEVGKVPIPPAASLSLPTQPACLCKTWHVRHRGRKIPNMPGRAMRVSVRASTT